MKDMSATEAARHFSEVLDAVQHRHESFLIHRKGRVVARLEPAGVFTGGALKSLVARHRPDRAWERELHDLRASLVAEERSWPG